MALGLLEQNVENASGYREGEFGEIISDIYLYNYSFDESGKLSVGAKKAANDDGQTALMGLTQNEATQLSVLVYLDGDVVDNSMVAAEAVASLSGSLNLQFSSDATLVPLDYSDLKAGAETSAESET